MKNSLIFLILLSIQSLFSKDACEKCNIEKVRIVHENINQLNVEMISDFLCTFDLKCKNNIEFTEFSNEIFFFSIGKIIQYGFESNHISKFRFNTFS